MLAQRTRARTNGQFHPVLESLESRCTPAQVWGWYNGTYAWHDDGTPAQDIQRVVVPSVIKVTVEAPTANQDGTLSAKVDLTAIKGNVGSDPLGVAILAAMSQPAVNAPAAFASQVNANSVQVAYANWQPGASFASATFTITFSPSQEPTFTATAVSPCWLVDFDTSALDAAFAQMR